MRTGCGIAALAAAARLVHADHDLIFPYVQIGDAGSSSDDWADWHAQIMDVQNNLTTYSVGCATTPCSGWVELPTFTVAIASTTFDLQSSHGALPLASTHTACTFFTNTGVSPAAFPTSASCEMTLTGNIGTLTTGGYGSQEHFTVPADTGSWVGWNVVSATLRVVDGTAAVASASTGAAGVGGASSDGGGGVTSGPTVTPTAGTAASGTASSGLARRTAAAEAWILGVGVAAGVMVGI